MYLFKWIHLIFVLYFLFGFNQNSYGFFISENYEPSKGKRTKRETQKDLTEEILMTKILLKKISEIVKNRKDLISQRVDVQKKSANLKIESIGIFLVLVKLLSLFRFRYWTISEILSLNSTKDSTRRLQRFVDVTIKCVLLH